MKSGKMDFGCLILAAGESRRMGTQKLLLEVQGKPILQHVIDTASTIGFPELVVVIGSQSDKIISKINFGSVKIVINNEYRAGLSSSLKLGLKSFTSNPDAYMVMLGDMPFIRPDTLRKLLEEHAKTDPFMSIPVYREKRGNPVIISRRAVKEVETLSGDSGARQLLERHPHEVMWIQVDDEGVILDVDTQEDYR
ncbi:MAG: molybdenum cofactor cytidylyltransferase, partial [Thermoprotei archaeon]